MTKKATTKAAVASKATVMKVTESKEFLPEGYKIPRKSDQFLKLTVGKHRLRIMSSPVRGFVFFSEQVAEDKTKKLVPVRREESLGNFTSEEMIEAGAKLNDDGNLEGAKYFWVVPVYNYNEKRFQVLDITQVSILDALMGFFNSDEYGDLRGYDITISRTGTNKNNTEYTVLPSPPKKIEKEVLDKYEALNCNPSAILVNEYPMQ